MIEVFRVSDLVNCRTELQSEQECDATEDAWSDKAGYIKSILL